MGVNRKVFAQSFNIEQQVLMNINLSYCLMGFDFLPLPIAKRRKGFWIEESCGLDSGKKVM